MSEPTKCKGCRHLEAPDGGHCYMFRTPPDGDCAQHTDIQGALRALPRKQRNAIYRLALAAAIMEASTHG